MYGCFLVGLGLLALAGCLLVTQTRALERRVHQLDQELVLLRAEADDRDDRLRRLGLALDRQSASLLALGRDVGWNDERVKTQVLGSPKPR